MTAKVRVMPPMLRLFGTPALVYDDVPHRLAVPAKALALLGLVAAQPGRALNRAQLASALYPDEPEAEARTAARRQLHVLTKALPGGAFILTKNTVSLSELLVTDVAAFLHDDDTPEALTHAVALRSGEYCAGVFDDALTALRNALDRRYADVLQRLTARDAAGGNVAAAARHLEQLVALDPLDEARVRALMEMRFAQGDRSGAMRDYHALVQRLRSELDVEPERETAALFGRMLFSPDATGTPHNLQLPSTSFVGRDRELHALFSALHERRLVTIVGPGGVGKTRLARRLAFDALETFPDGVWFVDLSPLKTEREFYEQVIAALQLRTLTSSDDPAASIVNELRAKRVLLVLDNCEHFTACVARFAQTLLEQTSCTTLCTSRKRLALGDEHLFALEPLDVPPSRRAGAADVKAFSAVRLFAERAVAVSPGFRITDENAPAVCEIVRKVYGMPLAVEIIAARANLLTVDGMLKRLSDGIGTPGRGIDSRHSTVHAAIAWSYDLLSEPEKQLFCALAVFAGGWDVEAAESVCAYAGIDVFATLSELVESSLVRADRIGEQIRYSMFEMTRDFALARMPAGDGAALLAQRHAQYYVSRAHDFMPEFKSAREVEYYRKIDEDYANFRTAAAWARTNDLSLAAQLVAALWRYAIFTWRMRDLEPLVSAVFADPACCDEQTLAQIHLATGMFAKERMEHEQAMQHLNGALALFRSCGDAGGEADTLYALAIVTFNHGDLSAARAIYEECLVLQEQGGDAKAIAATTANLGAIAHNLGDPAGAAALYRRALAGFRATGNERGVAYAYRSLALAYQDLGRIDEAIDAAERCVQAYEQLGEQSRLADGLITLGNTLAPLGRLQESFAAFARAIAALAVAPHPLFEALLLLGYADAAHHAGDYLEAARAAGKGMSEMQVRNMNIAATYLEFLERLIDRLRTELGEEQFNAAWNAGRQMTIHDFKPKIERAAQAVTRPSYRAVPDCDS